MFIEVTNKEKEKINMTGRRFSDIGVWHRGRDTLETDTYAPRRDKRRRKQMGYDPGPTFFVPSYGIRRPIVASEQLDDFLHDVREVLPKNYKIKTAQQIALTILEQRLIISKFHAIDVQPKPEEVSAVAQVTRTGLSMLLGDKKRGVPRRLPLPVGKVGTYGAKGHPTKLGIEPLGWRGFNAPYSDKPAREYKGTTRELPVLSHIINEVNLCIGAIHNGFTQYDDDPKFNTLNPFNRTPHITLAEKQRGGSISESEARAMCGLIEELPTFPEDIELFDPVIFMKLGGRSVDSTTLLVRPIRQGNLNAVPMLSDMAS